MGSSFLLRRKRPLLGVGTAIRVAPGSVLTVEGARGVEFFVVERGRAAVSRGDRPLAVLGPSDHFGEIALLTPERRRTATVTALDQLQVRVYDRREFSSLLDHDPQLEARLLRSAVARLSGDPRRPGVLPESSCQGSIGIPRSGR